MTLIDPSLIEILASATDLICGSTSREELLCALTGGVIALGFDSFNFGCHKADKYRLALDPTLTNWPDRFMLDYEGQRWADFDPTLAKAASTRVAFHWNVYEEQTALDHARYMEFLRSSPLKGGISVPLARREGMISSISVESHKSAQFAPYMDRLVEILANSALAKAEALGMCTVISADAAASSRQISAQQSEILKWASEGKSNADIAIILGLSERVVKYHMGEILKKLGVATRAQAIASLFRR